MTSCTRTPGCTGTIEDGYCNVCGMAAAPAPVATATAAPTATAKQGKQLDRGDPWAQ